ncbi:MAG: Gfo/Idh/MocA family oxidoreductase [Gammaproteobacteria bacterium]|nr:Gfo/Idh/MocA family oxidoreductase [Gammaproteobacteria bacterium]
MANKLRVGVVGVGYLGRFHTLIYSRMDNVELVGVSDSDLQQAEQVAAEAGTRVLSIEDMLDQVDAVSIVVPTTLHLEIARPFLQKGVHMLLEKPISSTVEEGREIVDLAKESGATLQIGHLERYNAGIMALAEHIEQPRFIDAQRMGGFKARATDVDVISDLMIHDIDIIMSLIDSEITSISASGTAVLTDHLDIANARLEFANGAAANVTASRISKEDSRRIRVFEPKHYLSLDFIGQRLERATAVPSKESEWDEIVSDVVDIDPVMPLDEELASFVDAIIYNKTPLVDGETGLKALDVALQIKQKIESE